jgi:hypothetical protein
MTTPPKPDVVSEERLREMRNGRLERLPSYMSAVDRVDLCRAIDELLAAREELAGLRGALVTAHEHASKLRREASFYDPSTREPMDHAAAYLERLSSLTMGEKEPPHD